MWVGRKYTKSVFELESTCTEEGDVLVGRYFGNLVCFDINYVLLIEATISSNFVVSVRL